MKEVAAEGLIQIVKNALTDPVYALLIGRGQPKLVRYLARVRRVDERARRDVLFFCRLYLGFEPTEYQKHFLMGHYLEHQFVAL